ncbi:MAG: hypothetical protein AMXMBFR7_52480 [Planctomycetota bacterium]
MNRYEIPGLAERPTWWRVRPDEISAQVQAARKGSVRNLATTPGGFPVWSLAYGGAPPAASASNWPSGSSSRNLASYKTGTGERQSVMLLCGIHGAEPEGVIGALNVISLLERGEDLRGQARPDLLALLARYRLLILPCVNMDGRAVSPDHLRGASDDQFRRASQGYWKDGSLIGYPTCKEYAPLPLDRVGHPGGYPNAAGYNIMHDAAPGDLRTEEARAVLKLAADEQVDLILNMHSHSIAARMLGQTQLCYPLHHSRNVAYQQRTHDALQAAGLRPAPVMAPGKGALNINTALAMACGGLPLTFEYPTTEPWSFDELLEHTYVVLKCMLEHGLAEPFSPRESVARGREA